jgi:Na+-transporting NADH:ubiquinone oxidoreductase subunit C
MSPADDKVVGNGGRPRFRDLPNDSTTKILVVATLVCIVCAVLVSSAAVLLRPIQQRNALLQKQRDILTVAGLYDRTADLDQQFKQIEAHLVDLDTGMYSDDADALQFDVASAVRDPSASSRIPTADDLAKIHRRAHQMPVYLVRKGTDIDTVILPIYGYGLWSTMYGYIALNSTGERVKAITFYDHGETPGLGAEIENLRWQALWAGKRTFDEQGKVALSVSKTRPAEGWADYHVDAISGATLTSVGVHNMIQYWLGEQGYGPYLSRLRDGGA